MIERLPELAAMTREEKWEVMVELEEELHHSEGSSEDLEMTTLRQRLRSRNCWKVVWHTTRHDQRPPVDGKKCAQV